MLSASKCYDTVELDRQGEVVTEDSCETPTFAYSTEKPAAEYDGVDIIISVDNSGSMSEEQEILSTGLYTLINSLTRPLSPEVDLTWGFPTVNDVRIGVVSSDMGLQWGEEGNTGGNTTDVAGCGNNTGSNGEFLGPRFKTINVKSGQIKCEDGGGQCPEGFNCNGNLCEGPGGNGTVNCPGSTPAFVETTGIDVNGDLATQVACMTEQGTEGCGVEQQLEAAVRGLENHITDDPTTSFLVDSHLLAILVISDEEDCSIHDTGLFSTEEWESGANELLNVACNYPAENNTYLFPADQQDKQEMMDRRGYDTDELSTYFERFVALKNGKAAAVLFGAIVGVPNGADSPCQGDGVDLVDNGCLDHPDMETRVDTFVIPQTNQEYQHFTPACTREDNNGNEVTSARPGRRYVKVAEEFGRNGYVYSICNEDWSEAMRDIAERITRQITPTCFPEALATTRAPITDCPDCVTVDGCDLYVSYMRAGADINDDSCPEELYDGLSQADRAAYLEKKYIEPVRADDGTLVKNVAHCAVPKIPTPLSCDSAAAYIDQGEVGWYYCEQAGENFDNACIDGWDNDNDSLVDCNDPDCAECGSCGGTGAHCQPGCRYGVEVTDRTMMAATGRFVTVKCGRQPMPEACNQ